MLLGWGKLDWKFCAMVIVRGRSVSCHSTGKCFPSSVDTYLSKLKSKVTAMIHMSMNDIYR